MIVERAFYGTDGTKGEIKKLDYSLVKVRYPSGFETVMKKCVAEVEAGRGKLEILGPATPKPKPQKPESKKIDRDKLVMEAIEFGLGTKEELLKLSNSEIVQLVGEDK